MNERHLGKPLHRRALSNDSDDTDADLADTVTSGSHLSDPRTTKLVREATSSSAACFAAARRSCGGLSRAARIRMKPSSTKTVMYEAAASPSNFPGATASRTYQRFSRPGAGQLTESSGGEDSPGHINPQKGVGQADNLSRFAVSF